MIIYLFTCNLRLGPTRFLLKDDAWGESGQNLSMNMILQYLCTYGSVRVPQCGGGTSKIGAHFDLCSPCCSLVCRVAMAAQAMSMQARFDSSFLCRLGASVELLHHLARPSREETMHRRERILMCARVTACRAACAAHIRYGSISRCIMWSKRGSLRLRRVGMIQ